MFSSLSLWRKIYLFQRITKAGNPSRDRLMWTSKEHSMEVNFFLSLKNIWKHYFWLSLLSLKVRFHMAEWWLDVNLSWASGLKMYSTPGFPPEIVARRGLVSAKDTKRTQEDSQELFPHPPRNFSTIKSPNLDNYEYSIT